MNRAKVEKAKLEAGLIIRNVLGKINMRTASLGTMNLFTDDEMQDVVRWFDRLVDGLVEERGED